MNLVVFQMLALIDGCYEELPSMRLIMDDITVSSCMHEYFLCFMEDGFP